MREKFADLKKQILPAAPRFSKAIGVGVIATGLAMGTGELVIWPHLVAKNGLSILWLALIGILSQVFINMEMGRHAIATGESFFTSSTRVFRLIPIFWILAAILLYIWPGWASAVGTILASLFNYGSHILWGRVCLILLLVIIFSGRFAYDILEKVLKIIVPSFFVLLLVISFQNIDIGILKQSIAGIFNFGTIPSGININVLLGAIIFAGAGGILNLCVSLWYRDKDFGMGSHSSKITNPITGKNEAISPTGYRFNLSDDNNLYKWRRWLKFMRLDQILIFGLLGFVSLFLLSLNAFSVLSLSGHIPEGLSVATSQAEIFSSKWGIFGEKAYLIMAFLMLFSVMWTIIDALARVISDVIHVNSSAGPNRKFFKLFSRLSIHQLYYGILSLIIFIGLILLPLNQPLSWLVLSGVFGALVMFVYMPIIIYVNNRLLEKELRPSIFTNIVLVLITVFYGILSYYIIKDFLTSFFK